MQEAQRREHLHKTAQEHCANTPDGSLGKLHPRNIDERGHGVEQVRQYVDCSARVSRYDSWCRTPARTRFGSSDIPMLRVWCAFAEKNDCRKDNVDEDMDHDRSPDDDPKCSRKVQHEDVGANTQLDQGHSVQIEQLTQP